ncbi:hypothetical protein V1264_015606 [Littorina saxatilis]|uniref:Uncharacterized protein n=1 Tax=Littorina saxatilis TaxID=31220 RepID=A0AAN9BK16_9CAEN
MAKSTKPSLSDGAENKRDALQAWRQDVLKWYPKLHERAYFVPPVYMKRINYDLQHIADQPVAVPKDAVKRAEKQSMEIDEGYELEDQEQQRILHCLQKFCEKHSASGSEGTRTEDKGSEHKDGEVMFVLSQLKFTSYLGEPCFAAAAQNFPRSVDLRKQKQDRGDFDVLVIHRHYGLLAAEIKSVGTLFTGKPESQEKEDIILVRRLNKIIKQLKRSGDVLRHLTSDIHDQLRVTKTLMLPNIAAAQLRRVLEDDPKLKKELCACFGIPDTEDPIDLCLTSDHMSARLCFWEVTDGVMKQLEQWWMALMTSKGKDPVMTKEVYEELVLRFAGPATTVEVFCPSAVSKASKVVRTEGEAVSETAARFMDFVLHQNQIMILNSGEHLVYLTGPPGTGKTVMLILQAEQWLKNGHDVHVISMYGESLAASLFMFHSLQAKCETKRHKIHLHEYQLRNEGTDDMVKAVDELAACAQDGRLYVIVDEVDGSGFKPFCDKMVSRVRSLHLWAAHIYHTFTPQHFTEFALAVPLRTPSAVTREIQRCDFIQKFGLVNKFEQNIYPHTDGPLIRELRHQGPDHPDDVMPRDCEVCGTQLASVLMELHVGGSVQTTKQTSESESPEPLKYRDVFLLSLKGFDDCGTDEKEMETKACGIIKGLLQSRIPVTVLPDTTTRSRERLLYEVTTMQGPDRVIATSPQCVFGLERKIVAWVQPAPSDTLTEQFDRLLACSRTSGQLITITTSRGSKQAKARKCLNSLFLILV